MIQKKVTDFFALEGNHPDLDGEGAAARLSAAIRCKTINYFDHSRTDYTEFDKLQTELLETVMPMLHDEYIQWSNKKKR